MTTSEGIATLLARALALLLFAAALLLSLPGIRIARAEEPDMTPVGVDEYTTWGIGEESVAEAALACAESVAAEPAESPEQASCGDVPASLAPHAAARPVAPSRPMGPPLELRPGEPGIEVRPGVVLLNRRGYNYGSVADTPEADILKAQREAAPAAD